MDIEMATGFPPRQGRRAPLQCCQKPCPPSTTQSCCITHQPCFRCLILSRGACGCFVGNHYLHVLHGYSSAPEFSSDKTGLCPCTLWPHVLDLLVSKCLGRTIFKSSGTSLLGHVPFEPATKMQ